MNVLFITLDTTRADRIGAYGYTDIQTPNLDRLAREGVLFEQAASAAPLTLPAHSSLFTGKFPPEHGVRDNGGFFLDPRETTLAEVLKAPRLQTGGFIGAYVLDSKWGINQGFDTYFDHFDLSKYKAISLGAIQRPGNEVVDEGLQWLDAHRLVAILRMDTPLRRALAVRAARAVQVDLSRIARTSARSRSWTRRSAACSSYLEAHDLLDKTIVVVIGDHGESLGEHGEATHGFFVYQSDGARAADHPRAVFRRARRPPRRGCRAQRGRDADRARAAGRAGRRAESRCQRRAADDRRKKELGLDTYSEAMYPLHHFGWSDLRAMRAGRYKLIAAPRPELYDLQDDPGEHHDVFAAAQALGTRMLEQPAPARRRFAKRDPSDAHTDRGRSRRPRAPGGARLRRHVRRDGGARRSAQRTRRSEGQDRRLQQDHRGARDLSKDDSAFDEVVTMLQDVVREDPKVIDAWFMLGNVYAKVGRAARGDSVLQARARAEARR